MNYWIEISDRTDIRTVAATLGATDLSEDVRPDGRFGETRAIFRRRDALDFDDACTEWDTKISLDPNASLNYLTQLINIALAARQLDGSRRGGLIDDNIPLFIWQTTTGNVWYNRSLGRIYDPQTESSILSTLKRHNIDPILASEDEIADNVFTPEPLGARQAHALQRVETIEPVAVDPGPRSTTLTPTSPQKALEVAIALDQELHRHDHLDHVATLRRRLQPLLLAALNDPADPIMATKDTQAALDPTPHQAGAPYPYPNADLADALQGFSDAYTTPVAS